MDNDVTQLRNDLAQYMERFKRIYKRKKTRFTPSEEDLEKVPQSPEMHTNVLDVQQDTMLIEDIKADLKSMEAEKEGLTRKIEKTYKKIQNLPALE
ncbi:hypothetical protein OSTOST_24599, partial [Ostertagia ostertagi]